MSDAVSVKAGQKVEFIQRDGRKREGTIEKIKLVSQNRFLSSFDGDASEIILIIRTEKGFYQSWAKDLRFRVIDQQ